MGKTHSGRSYELFRSLLSITGVMIQFLSANNFRLLRISPSSSHQYMTSLIQESHLLPRIDILPHQLLTNRSTSPQRSRMLRALSRIQDQPAARHANEIPLQESDKPARWIIRLHGSGKLTHATDPFLEWDYVRTGNIESSGEDKDHVLPWLARRVFDVVDRIGFDFGDE